MSKYNPSGWYPKLYAFLQMLFEEEDEDEDQEEEEGPVPGIQERPEVQMDNQGGNTSRGLWNLLAFLDLVNCIFFVLPVLGYTSSHWTIYHVQNTRELHEHIIGTAIFLLMGLFFLFLAFPRIMRFLLFGSILLLATLPLLFPRYHYSSMWENYRKHVTSLPVKLDNRVQGYLFYADKTSDKIEGLVFKNAEHENLRNYLIRHSYYTYGMGPEINGVTDYKSCIALFEQVCEEWTYKADPANKERYRSPHRTILTFTGDCEDYTMLVTSLFITQGYRMRIIMGPGHVYPELAIPNEDIYEAMMEPLIKTSQHYIADGSPPLCYHKDNTGTVWLNLDYTALYPGGPFMHEQVLKIIYLN